jgi:Protein of unknwon function (DUF3310)
MSENVIDNVRAAAELGVFNVDLAPEVLNSFLNGSMVETVVPDNVPMYVPKKNIDYKYSEDSSLAEISAYIDSTYGEHYSQDKFQATEFIIDSGHGTGFCMGNVMKYAQRYGKKGSPADARKDLLKVIHYAIMQLHVHDLQNGSK